MSRVLLVGKGPPDHGGIPTFLQQIMTGELTRDHELSFLNVARGGTREGGRFTGGNLARTLGDAVAVWRRAKGHDVVHINSSLAPAVTVLRAGLLALAGRLRGCAVIVHAHGGNIETWLTTPRARWLTRLAMLPVATVAAVWTAGEVALAEALGERRVRLVVNGVDTARFTSVDAAPGAPPRVLYVGLLTPRKGVLDLVQASRQLSREGVDHELVLLGGIPDEGPDAAERVVSAAAGHAVLLGTRAPDEMPAAYASADIFCLPSWWEAMPLSLLEAMAAGLPVVATDVGDVARIVRDGEHGLVVPPRSPAELAGALRTMIEHRDRATAMGRAAQSRVEACFSAASTARAIGELYDQAAGAR